MNVTIKQNNTVLHENISDFYSGEQDFYNLSAKPDSKPNKQVTKSCLFYSGEQPRLNDRYNITKISYKSISYT